MPVDSVVDTFRPATLVVVIWASGLYRVFARSPFGSRQSWSGRGEMVRIPSGVPAACPTCSRIAGGGPGGQRGAREVSGFLRVGEPHAGGTTAVVVRDRDVCVHARCASLDGHGQSPANKGVTRASVPAPHVNCASSVVNASASSKGHKD